MTTLDTLASTITGEGRVTAVTYQRVSTKEQATAGGRDEGFSIPAQREANRRKADTLNAHVVAEFVDAGESARSAKRPGLQQLLDYIATHQVTYCIVHKVWGVPRLLDRFSPEERMSPCQRVGVVIAPSSRTKQCRWSCVPGRRSPRSPGTSG